MNKPSITPGLRQTAMFRLVVVAALLLSMFAGCKTIHTNTLETKTVTVKERDTTLIYKGGSVSNQNSLDSILKYLSSQEALKQRLNGIQTKVIYTDAQNKVALTFWLDKYGKLQADCSSKDSSWTAKLKDIETRYEKQSTQTKTVKEKYVPARFWILFGILCPFAVIGLFVSIKAIVKII